MVVGGGVHREEGVGGGGGGSNLKNKEWRIRVEFDSFKII